MRTLYIVILAGIICASVVAGLIKIRGSEAERRFSDSEETFNEALERDQEPLKHDSMSITLFIKSQRLDKEEDSFIKTVYQKGDSNLIWFKENKLRPELLALIEKIEKSGQHGLFPEEYDYHYLKTFAESYDDDHLRKGILQAEEIKQADLRATLLFYDYASDLQYGRINPGKARIKWPMLKSREGLDDMLISIMNFPGKDPLGVLEPKGDTYNKLKAELAKFRKEKSNHQWSSIEGVTVVKPGDTSTVIPGIKERLKYSGVYNGDMSGQIYDEMMKEAVKSFQSKNGLGADGVIGPKTLSALNKINVADREETIIINMERLRWMPESLGDDYLLVNLPEFRLHVFENGREVMTMKNISGKLHHATPVFHDSMQYVVLSPNWNVPSSIAVNEILPALRRNPGYLHGENMVAYTEHGRQISPYSVDWNSVNTSDFKYRFQQRPGSHNALGLVKFLFPNNYKIYMHDTPTKSLFNQEVRAFSHGCIRLEQPFELARYLLRDHKEWDDESIRAAMWSGKEKWVTLKKKIPVFILYYTAFVNEYGEVEYRSDIYGYDAKLKAAYFNKAEL